MVGILERRLASKVGLVLALLELLCFRRALLDLRLHQQTREKAQCHHAAPAAGSYDGT